VDTDVVKVLATTVAPLRKNLLRMLRLGKYTRNKNAVAMSIANDRIINVTIEGRVANCEEARTGPTMKPAGQHCQSARKSNKIIAAIIILI
jgi:hypothetical protein